MYGEKSSDANSDELFKKRDDKVMYNDSYEIWLCD